MSKKTNGTNGDPPSDAPPSGHNGPTDEQIRQFARSLLDEKQTLGEVMESASASRGRSRAIYKRAKSAGISKDVLKRVVDDLGRDPDELLAEEREYLRIASLMRMPLRQTDLFPEQAAQSEMTGEEKSAHDLWVARNEGYTAGRAGHDINNSCRYVQGEETWTKFREGWHDGQAHLAKGLTSPKTRGRRGAVNPEDRAEA